MPIFTRQRAAEYAPGRAVRNTSHTGERYIADSARTALRSVQGLCAFKHDNVSPAVIRVIWGIPL